MVNAIKQNVPIPTDYAPVQLIEGHLGLSYEGLQSATERQSPDLDCSGGLLQSASSFKIFS